MLSTSIDVFLDSNPVKSSVVCAVDEYFDAINSISSYINVSVISPINHW